jgi:hypothetical protein
MDPMSYNVRSLPSDHPLWDDDELREATYTEVRDHGGFDVIVQAPITPPPKKKKKEKKRKEKKKKLQDTAASLYLMCYFYLTHAHIWDYRDCQLSLSVLTRKTERHTPDTCCQCPPRAKRREQQQPRQPRRGTGPGLGLT